jgi:hypothetical protein
LNTTSLLTSLIERLSNESLGIGKSISYFSGSLVCQVLQSIVSFVQELILSFLEAFPTSRANSSWGLLGAQGSKSLVSPLNCGFGFPARDQDGLLTIRYGNESVNPEVHSDLNKRLILNGKILQPID